MLSLISNHLGYFFDISDVCPPPVNIMNGTSMRSTEIIEEISGIGEFYTTRYRCAEGFYLDGKDVQRCHPKIDNKWWPTEQPTCQGNVSLPVLIYIGVYIK